MILYKHVLDVSWIQVREMSFLQLLAYLPWLEVKVVKFNGKYFVINDITGIKNIIAFWTKIGICTIFFLANRA